MISVSKHANAGSKEYEQLEKLAPLHPLKHRIRKKRNHITGIEEEGRWPIDILPEMEQVPPVHPLNTVSDVQQFLQLLQEDWTISQSPEAVSVLTAISNHVGECDLLEFFFCMLALHIKNIYTDTIAEGKGVR